MARTRVENVPFNRVAVTLFIIFITVGAIATALINHPAPVIAGVLIGIYFLFAIKVAQQWENAALLRLGHLDRRPARGQSGIGQSGTHIVPLHERKLTDYLALLLLSCESPNLHK